MEQLLSPHHRHGRYDRSTPRVSYLFYFVKWCWIPIHQYTYQKYDKTPISIYLQYAYVKTSSKKWCILPLPLIHQYTYPSDQLQENLHGRSILINHQFTLCRWLCGWFIDIDLILCSLNLTFAGLFSSDWIPGTARPFADRRFQTVAPWGCEPRT